MQPDEQGALVIPNNNFFAGRQGYKPKYVIVHGTAGGTSAQAIASYFQSTEGGDSAVSSNYVIGTDGTVVQCVAESDGAYANGIFSMGHDAFWDTSVNPNLTTVSIEHCKPSEDNSDQITPAQLSASFTLIKHICERHGIPKHPADSSGGITGHFSIDPVNRSRCPGAYPWAALWDYLQEGKNTMGVPNGWNDNAQTGVLTAPNGITVVRGFRDYILANNWDANNLPLQVEQPMNPLELSNPGLGGGTQQVFRWTVLEWNADRGVFVSWVGQEVLATRKALHDAYAQIATLQQQENTQLLKQIADYTNRFNQIGQLASQVAQLVKVPQA